MAINREARIVVLTGAGISAESGIQTFRDANGLWHNHRIEDVASPEGFQRDPALVHRFYNQRRVQLLSDDIQPNAAHVALAALEAEMGDRLTLVTQNIDDLHERGGHASVMHMHGELLKVRCGRSGQVFVRHDDTSVDTSCECCGVAGALRPHIVWFGEMPFGMDAIYDALITCDLFIAIGTSGHVYPAAGFVQIAQEAGAKTLELNLAPSQQQSNFMEGIYGPASETVPDLVRAVLASST